ncbi:hypothetical protein F5Y00DRAFT_264841 [Daldinia vernicosa]|uniref:uncharacterized protein n=1 Tax=Daldinia vernicosa TaxID=114800 RepID=UPI002007909E|nr:uncharacterized protein F5Y00DRAFT_264841 [Daldinia vernicosa]KAI0846124.1 hypothetical protein F5Y00DRAFT_264841 [Daldinia vernicosa]
MVDSYNVVVDRLNAFTPADFEGYEVERLKLLSSARKLVNLGIWHRWTAVGGGEKTVEELAKLATKDCDLNLLRRLLRLLGATYVIEETGEDRYKPTDLSLSIGDESTTTAQYILSMAHHWNASFMNLPSFLAKTSYREPLDPKYNNYDSFSGCMMEWSKYRFSWPDFYDTTSLVAGADLASGAPLVVDIGGHHGYDTLTFLKKHPDVPDGSLVIQDLEAVLADANLGTDKVKLMPHIFFEPQPIYGSRAYFLREVFHDY